MRLLQSALLAAAAFAHQTLADLQTFVPLTSGGPSYSIGIPSSSSISATSNGAFYVQIRAPKAHTFVALGIGEQMAGARIFVMYADGNGNVTISARRGTGHVQPQNDDTLQSGVELLAGSGLVGEDMVANIKVSSTVLESSKSATDSNFIAAWMPGNPLNSTSLTASIRQHTGDAYRQFTLDLSKAVLATDANPFPSSPDSSNAPISNTGGGTVIGTDGNTLATYQKAHGIIMSVAILLLFPLGAVFIRLGGNMWGHVAIQTLALLSLIVGFGLGIKLGNITDLLFNTSHTIFGTVIFAAFLLQPLFGIAHHLQYEKHSQRTPISHVHIWYGRAILFLGVVNGGLGLKLAANSKSGTIAYGVVAAIVGVVYVALVIVWNKGRGRKRVGEDGSEEVRMRNLRIGREKKYGGS